MAKVQAKTTKPARTRVERLTEALEAFNVACGVKVLLVTGVKPTTAKARERTEQALNDARAELSAALTEFTAPLLRVVGRNDG